MSSPFSEFSHNRSNSNIDVLNRANPIFEIARELGIPVGKNVVHCIKREKHVNSNGVPTMTFNLIKNTFRCWVCPDVCGDVVDLVMLAKDVDRERAIQFLSIRSDIKTDNDRAKFFKGKSLEKMESSDREAVFKDFFSGMENDQEIDLIAFASTKGGTGKTLVVNNIAVILSLITRYIGSYRKADPQHIELIDLDFGKPDQRLLLGVDPEYYIEDVFYQQPKELLWDCLREHIPLENLKLVSSCPIRKSKSLYYLKKNEILYMLHNSDANIKLVDFSGGSDKDTLDFLSSIKSKVFVINPDRASVEAVFNLILSLLYYPMKQQFKGSKDALALAEKLRDCSRNGFTVNDLRDEIHRIDKKRSGLKKLKNFYKNTVEPFQTELGMSVSGNGSISIGKLKQDLPALHNKVHEILFHSNSSYSYSKKRKIYRTFTDIEHNIRVFDSFTSRLDNLLTTSLFGLVINKCDKELADTVAGNLVDRIGKTFSMNLSHLGNIPEEEALRNISDYGMPFTVHDPEHEVLNHFFKITDTIIRLKSGSTEKIVFEQRDYLKDLKKNWLAQTKPVGVLA